MTRMEFWAGALSWWKCYRPNLKSASFFPRNLFLNFLKTSTLILWPINCGVLTSLLLPHLSSSLIDSLPFFESLMPLQNWCSIHAKLAKNSLKYSIHFWGIFPSLKHNFIAYRSSKVTSRPNCIFEIHHLWQSGLSRVYSNSCCRYPF